MQDFSDFHEMVREMMKDFGTQGTLVSRTGGDYDPATGEVSVSDTETSITCILMDMTLQSNGSGTKDKTLIQDGDKVLYVEPSPNVQSIDSTSDKVVVGGITYDIVTMKMIDPTATNSSPLLYELYLRK